MKNHKKEFKARVWQLTKKIPYGRITTYKEIAERLNTKAYRAVGNALNKNKSKEVPCHRVVRSDRTVGGFAKGTKRKIIMLKKEGIKIKNRKILDFNMVFFRLKKQK